MDNRDSTEPKLSQLDVPQDSPAAFEHGTLRVLFVGNSITLHGANEKTARELGWTHVSGMAASSADADYAHLLAAKLKDVAPAGNVQMLFHTGGGGGSIAQRLSAVEEALFLKPDVVVIQLGEHEGRDLDIADISRNYRGLVSTFLSLNPRPQIICTGLWDPDEGPSGYAGWRRIVEDTMKRICLELEVPFVSVEDLALKPEYHGAGQHPGVRWHPNDLGHREYASRIFQSIVGDQIS